jgi:voltage-gated potassium channel
MRDETLREAGVLRARGLIAALATDAENVFVILSAKTLSPDLTVVARASEEDAEQKLRRAGADTVLSPYSIAGHRLAQALVRPHVVQLIDLAGRTMGLDVTTEQLRVTGESRFAVKELGEVARRDSGVIVLALSKSDGKTIFNPPRETKIAAGDILVVMGEQPSLRALERLLTDGSD